MSFARRIRVPTAKISFCTWAVLGLYLGCCKPLLSSTVPLFPSTVPFLMATLSLLTPTVSFSGATVSLTKPS